MTKKKIFPVSHTKIATFLDCETKYRHRYIRRVYPRTKGMALHIGSAFHSFMEHYWATRKIKSGLQAIEDYFGENQVGLMGPNEIREMEVAKATTVGMATQYVKVYPNDFDEFEEIHTELDLQKEKGLFMGETASHKVYYGGIIDALVKDAAGDWWIFETKTVYSGKAGDNYLDRIQIDNQVLGYMHLAKHFLGEFPTGVIYNIVCRHALKGKGGETLQAFAKRILNEYKVNWDKKKYYLRHRVQISQAHLSSWWDEQSHTANMIGTKHGIKSKQWPKNTNHCVNNWGRCEYLTACISNTYNPLLYHKLER